MDAHLIRLQPHTFPALTSSSNSSNDVYPLAMPSNPNSAPSFPAKKPLSILTSLEIEPIDPTVFRSQSLWTPAGARGAFGGQVIAQALNAAAQTVGVPGKGGEWTLHSQHCYFLLAVNSSEPVIYRVEKLRDGRSYVTRQVTATQSGIPVFILSCSFTLPSPASALQPCFQIPMPVNVPTPEQCELEEDRWARVLDERLKSGREVEVGAKKGLMAYIRERKESPIALKEIPRSSLMQFPIAPNEEGTEPTLCKPRKMQVHERMLWMRAKDAAVQGEGANMQKCILAYISDFQFIGSAAQSVGLSHTSQPRLGMLASLDHVVYWYSTSFKTTDWLLHVISAPRTGEGRGVVEGRFYTQEGELIAVTVQEGVVRAAKMEGKAKL